jgi:hypothetical protein
MMIDYTNFSEFDTEEVARYIESVFNKKSTSWRADYFRQYDDKMCVHHCVAFTERESA